VRRRRIVPSLGWRMIVSPRSRFLRPSPLSSSFYACSSHPGDTTTFPRLESLATTHNVNCASPGTFLLISSLLHSVGIEVGRRVVLMNGSWRLLIGGGGSFGASSWTCGRNVALVRSAGNRGRVGKMEEKSSVHARTFIAATTRVRARVRGAQSKVTPLISPPAQWGKDSRGAGIMWEAGTSSSHSGRLSKEV
jgi:hypothetical protein